MSQIKNNLREVGIAGVGHYAPERIMHNTELEAIVETSDEWIFTRTGMRERRIAAEGESCSDLCFHAAKMALENAEMKAEELDLIIVATVTPDQWLPATTAFLQMKLGAKNAGGWDINNACTGFMSAMMSASSMISAGAINNCLIVGAEVLSSILNWNDRTSCILFGDGAGAAVLKADCEQGRILHTTSGMDGHQWDAIERRAGGSAHPCTLDLIEKRAHLMTLKGNDVFKFAVGKFRDLINEQVEFLGGTCDDIDLVVPHQVNSRIIESALKKLAIDGDRVYTNLDRYSNTSAASIPLAFSEAYQEGVVKKGQLISMIAFGAGLGWGSTLLRW